jgi:hypothetical protein
MNQVKLQNNDGSFLVMDLPSNWNELLPHELLYIAKRWESYTNLIRIEESLGKAKALLTAVLIRGNKKQIIDAIKLIDQLPNEEKVMATQLVNFVFQTCDLTNQLFSVIKTGWKKLYGPDERCSNLTFGEFMFCERYFESYLKSRKDIDLLKLAAVLYRPSQKGVRVAFDKDFDINKNLKLIDNFSYEHLQAIVLFYCGCRNAWIKQYKNVFGGQNGKPLPSNVNFGMMNVAFGLADMGGLGNINDIQNHNVHVVLQRWELLIHNQAEADKNG